MIKVTLLTAVMMSAFFSTAQDTTKSKKINEYYMGVSNIVPLEISLKYKRQLKNNTFFKIGLVDLSAKASTDMPESTSKFSTENYSISAGLELGLEFRKQVTEKFTFFHGPNLGFSYRVQTSTMNDPSIPIGFKERKLQDYVASIPYTFGLLFQLNSNFFLSTEINPGLFASFSEIDNGSNSNTNFKNTTAGFKLSNNNSLLSIGYRL